MDRLLCASQSRVVEKDHSQDTMMLAENAVVDIIMAEYVADYKLRLKFSDNKERVVDFEPFLRNTLNPMIRKYLDLESFKNFTVEHGDLFWDDYDLCFPISDLYEVRI
jgi:hypothetical protein